MVKGGTDLWSVLHRLEACATIKAVRTEYNSVPMKIPSFSCCVRSSDLTLLSGVAPDRTSKKNFKHLFSNLSRVRRTSRLRG